MKNIILVLEDNSSMNRHLVEHLNEQLDHEEYEVKDCSRIDLAKEFFDEHKDEILCIITDLNMDDEWVDDEFVKETQGGIFSGWVWLQHYVYTEKSDMPTIIYSGYINYLKDYLRSKGEFNKLNKGNIYIVNKGSSEGEGFKGLLHNLKTILKK